MTKSTAATILLAMLFSTVAYGGAIRVDADIPLDAAYADSVIHVTAGRLEPLVGFGAPDSLDVYIVTTQDKFDSLAGDAIPDWGAGVAIPYKYRIVIKSPRMMPGDKPLGELMAHEYAHMVMAHAVGYREVPRWLDEGMAMYMSAEWSWDDNVAMARAVIVGGEIPLTEIEYLNRFTAPKAQVAYSESFLAFKYFLDTYGKSSLRILLSGIASGQNIDDALVTAIGADYGAFEREFAGYLHGRYNIVSLLFDSNLFWILLAVIAVVGFIIVRLRRHKRIEQLDEYDALHSTDFDYGEVEKPDEDKPWD
ncbi:MAG: peptidase MA family metallohydrolase [candidate division Zixibacteria bacterium]|nr:peptidase MA family metallohydrolase [candidate division Zixibacteria bacterium]